MRLSPCIFAFAFCLPLTAANANDLTVDMNKVTSDGVGTSIGTVRLVDQNGGLKLIVDIKDGLSDGLHGFHVHQKPSCEPAEKDGKMVAAASAGGHFDPQETGKHMGPSGNGHLGDLPVISVVEGNASNEVLWAPRLTVDKVKGHALMIHAGGDNYRDDPEKLGGGGARAACGVLPKSS